MSVAALVDALQQDIDAAGIDYRVLPGGELRLSRDTVRIFERRGVPVLGGTRVDAQGAATHGGAVLFDLWDRRWPRWGDRAVDWLLQRGYTPLLAHPERTARTAGFHRAIDQLTERGVLLQGNLRSLTAAEGERDPEARNTALRLLDAGRYTTMALDMHRIDSLQPRLEGIDALIDRVGKVEAERLLDAAPRALLSG